MTSPSNIFDEQKLEALLSERRLDEAKAYVGEFLKSPSAMGDKVGAAIDYAHIYMRAMNRINERYLQSLKQTEALLARAASMRAQADDAMEIARLRSSLR